MVDDTTQAKGMTKPDPTSSIPKYVRDKFEIPKSKINKACGKALGIPELIQRVKDEKGTFELTMKIEEKPFG